MAALHSSSLPHLPSLPFSFIPLMDEFHGSWNDGSIPRILGSRHAFILLHPPQPKAEALGGGNHFGEQTYIYSAPPPQLKAEEGSSFNFLQLS